MTYKKDNSYPYEYAYDLIRLAAGVGPKLSRIDAEKIVDMINNALDLDKRKLCEELADYLLKNKSSFYTHAIEEAAKFICPKL